MTKVFEHSHYAKLVEETIQQIHSLSTLKGGEYAGDQDRLANFRRNAEAVDSSMELVWRIYAGKHWDAITQYVKDLQSETSRPRSESITGRADDLIVYLILFKAMVWEREIQTRTAKVATPYDDVNTAVKPGWKLCDNCGFVYEIGKGMHFCKTTEK